MTNSDRQKHTVRDSVVALIFFVLFSVSALGQEPTAADNDLETVLKFEPTLDLIVVPVEINGETVRCALDTGMPEGVFLFSPGEVERLSLTANGVANVNGTGPGSLTAAVCTADEVAVGDIKLGQQRVIVVNQNGHLMHLGFDGAIGASVFNRNVVHIDCDAGEVRLFRIGKLVPPASSTVLPLEIEDTKAFVQAEVAVHEHKRESVKLLLDTGSNQSLSLIRSDTLKIDLPETTFEAETGSGVGGDTFGLVGRITALKLKEEVIADVVTAFPNEASENSDGTLGMEVLRRFNFTIDYPNRRIWLTPNSKRHEPFECTMTGMAIKPNDAGEFVVQSIWEPSPASEAGISKGDVVVAVDGKPYGIDRFVERDRHWRTSGIKVRFTLRREGREFDVTLTTKRLL